MVIIESRLCECDYSLYNPFNFFIHFKIFLIKVYKIHVLA